jgi:putative endonuclease
VGKPGTRLIFPNIHENHTLIKYRPDQPDKDRSSPKKENMTKPQNAKNRHLRTGERGEAFVATWLEQQQYKILYRRWNCRLGELDLVAVSPDRTIALVEVKTRSARNWDLDGLLAISHQKRQKLWKTAQLFLMAHPDLADRVIRFDVALVRYQPQALSGNDLKLQDYLIDAFSD